MVIGPDNKSPQQVMAIHAVKPDYRQQLLARSAVFPQISSQTQALISYRLLYTLLYLAQLGPNGVS
jgi:hypothetical protein